MLFKRSLLCLAISATLPFYACAENTTKTEYLPDNEEEIEFNDQFLLNGSSNIDINRFARGNPVLPGTYRTKINLNGKLKSTVEVTFKDNGTPRATPCITKLLLAQSGVDTSSLAEEPEDDASCIDIKKAFPGATVNYDSGKQALDLNFPQIYILKRPAGYVDPSLWENGIPAALLSYDMNAWHSESNGSTSESAYMGLRYGINMGPWRLRSRGNLNWDKDSGTKYSSQDIYLQRDITPLSAQFVVGDSYTRGEAFDSLSLRGARMYSDDRMLPMGSTGYAPVIRGTANSNAKVSVMQSGNKIYETSVPPGAFEINDLSTTGYGNDLLVTIEEADGSKRSFTVPFSSVTQMLRPGATRWDVGLGELNDDSLIDAPKVGYGTLYYGLNNTFTGYIGAQYSDMDFYAGILGLAMNTSIGAFALDATQSHADIEGFDTLSGQSYRLTFSKVIEATETSFNIAAYRFATEDYLSLNDAAQLQDSIKRQNYSNRSYNSNEDLYADYQRTKNQVQISLNQPLNSGETSFGSLYVSGTWQDYWNASGSTSNYNIGYNNSFTYGSYSLSLQRTYDQYGKKDDSVYLSLSIPLNLFSHDRANSGGFSNLNMGLRSDLKGGTSFNTSAGGNTEDNKISYSVSAASNSGNYGDLNQISGYGSWNSAYGPLGLSASFGDDNSKQYSASYNGGMVLHSGGIAFAPGSIGDSDALALVKASGAKGAGIGFGSSQIGDSGYGILPYMSAYRENRVYLDISTLENDVEITNTSEIAVPRSGSIVLVNFETNEGRSLILELQRTDKGFIPLGADVLNEKNESVGTVGQAGQAYVRGVEDQGVLHVVWGNDKDSKCDVQYQILPNAQKVGLTTVLNNQQCQM
ncbi:outer membrane usher protein [Salmonella enterica]|uniref:Outer membrane usher protein n=1 Tax=Salmonella enterica subsp. enterica serovar Macclesfield str. S-1643 TaxID=1242107 RepID=A0A2C9P3M2_SALET|nr:outer membrane usher protein [Salmonella enterica]ASG18016.1 outer membrane usher protein [Salmonella enterica subsp. enterica serovar Macclesfield str. S-1643]EAA5485122.1 outer membrane usher protein [Salmonella enterica subsp. enterica serovar Kouka]EBS1106091.1 outer membrane usher protein [Salmonella enterica subsp. enterica serovar Eingedi]